MALIGYARVSTAEQSLGLQRDALAGVGCETVFEDHSSGAKAERPGLADALVHLRRGDALVVWKLDRLGRSMAHLIDTVRQLESKGVGFRSLTEGVDTMTPGGTLVFHIFGALAQFERDLIRERTNAGLKAAEARGRKGGRKPVVTATEGTVRLIELYNEVIPEAKPVTWPGGGYQGMTEALNRAYDAVAFELMSPEDAADQFLSELQDLVN